MAVVHVLMSSKDAVTEAAVFIVTFPDRTKFYSINNTQIGGRVLMCVNFYIA